MDASRTFVRSGLRCVIGVRGEGAGVVRPVVASGFVTVGFGGERCPGARGGGIAAGGTDPTCSAASRVVRGVGVVVVREWPTWS